MPALHLPEQFSHSEPISDDLNQSARPPAREYRRTSLWRAPQRGGCRSRGQAGFCRCGRRIRETDTPDTLRSSWQKPLPGVEHRSAIA